MDELDVVCGLQPRSSLENFFSAADIIALSLFIPMPKANESRIREPFPGTRGTRSEATYQS
jgi:hypothetical protein